MEQVIFPAISSLYVGLLAIMLVGLSVYVVKGRFKHQVGLADGGNKDMLKRIRAHANFTEYVPMLVLMLVIMELNGFPAWMLHIYGLGILITRLLHAYGLHISSVASKPRFLGTAGTFFLLITGAVLCIGAYIL